MLGFISKNDRIFGGIEIEDHCCKLYLFADDLTIYLNFSTYQLEWVTMKLDILALASICKVNFQKSQVIFSTLTEDKLQKPFKNKELNWPATEIKDVSDKIVINRLDYEKNYRLQI